MPLVFNLGNNVTLHYNKIFLNLQIRSKEKESSFVLRNYFLFKLHNNLEKLKIAIDCEDEFENLSDYALQISLNYSYQQHGI